MQQPVKSEKKEEPRVEVLPQETPQEQEKITIDAGTGQPVTPSSPAPSSVSPEEFKKIQARMEYQARQNERLQQQLAETLQRLNQQPAPQRTEKPKSEDFDEDLHAIAQTNYQKAMAIQARREAEKTFKELMDKERQEQQLNFTKQQSLNQLEREKSWVLEKTPSLNDETSDEFKGYYATYNRMISEDPTLVSNPRAPRLVWYEWNASNGEKVTVPNAEAERLKRVAAGAAPQGRQTSGKPKTYQLTQDEIEMCKNSGLSPAAYARAKEYNFNEGVTA